MLSTSYPYCRIIHQDLQAGKTGFKSGYYVTSKHSVPKHIYDCMLLTPQSKHDCGRPGNEIAVISYSVPLLFLVF